MTTRQQIVDEARSWLGTRYHHQASVKQAGCDCLGLVRGVYRNITGVEPEQPPPYSRDWAETLRQETLIDAAERHLKRVDLTDLQPGNVVIFRFKPTAMAKHAGILTSDSTMIHAAEKAPVCEVNLSDWWNRRIAAVFQFPEIENGDD